MDDQRDIQKLHTLHQHLSLVYCVYLHTRQEADSVNQKDLKQSLLQLRAKTSVYDYIGDGCMFHWPRSAAYLSISHSHKAKQSSAAGASVRLVLPADAEWGYLQPRAGAQGVISHWPCGVFGCGEARLLVVFVFGYNCSHDSLQHSSSSVKRLIFCSEVATRKAQES